MNFEWILLLHIMLFFSFFFSFNLCPILLPETTISLLWRFFAPDWSKHVKLVFFVWTTTSMSRGEDSWITKLYCKASRLLVWCLRFGDDFFSFNLYFLGIKAKTSEVYVLTTKTEQNTEKHFNAKFPLLLSDEAVDDRCLSHPQSACLLS